LQQQESELIVKDRSKACAANVKLIDCQGYGYRLEPVRFSSVKLSVNTCAHEVAWLTEQGEAKFAAQVQLAKYLQC